MKRTVLVLMALFAAVGCVLAQPRTVTGVVTSAEDGSTLPQLAVQIKGSGTGVVTDLDGRYRIQVSGPEAVLVFAFVGMQEQEIAVGDQTTIDVVMQPSNQEIDQVVVMAYGTQKRSSITGSVTSVDSKKLEKLPGTDVTKAMEGQLAGVTISSSSGGPGSATTIRIRGIGSINASNSPLIILDGAPYDGSLNSINPADIDSYNVLKDAASAALYGARAANGVILITTKQGRAGQTVVNYDGRIGYNFRGVPEYDLITDPGQFYEASWRALRNSILAAGETEENANALASKYLLTGFGKDIEGLGGYRIYKGVGWDEVVLPDGKLNPKAKEYVFADKKDWNDWHKALFQPRMRQEHNLSVSKGMDRSNVYFSLSYLDDNGYSLNSYFKRFTSRLNVSQQVYKWLDFTNKFQFVYSDRNANAGGGLVANPFGFVRRITPIYPIYRHNLDGSITRNIDGGNEYEDGTGRVDGNPHVDPTTGEEISYARPNLQNANLRASQDRDLRQTRSWIINNVAGLVAHLPWNFHVSANLAYTGEFYKSLNRQAKFGDAKQFGGRLTTQPNQQQGINATQIIDWNWSFLEKDALNVAVKLGHEAYFMRNETVYGRKSNLLYEQATELQYAGKFETLTGYQHGYSLEGYFAQLSSDYLSRYSLSASFRRDGSSVFHPDHRWGNFWSVGAAWRISSEPFFEKATDYVNSLKLRVSYGLQGNDYLYTPGGDRNWTPYQDLYDISTNNGKVVAQPVLKGNKEITWEKNYNLSTAIEFGFLHNLVYGEVEFFTRTTRDMLFNLPIPASSGYTTKPVNIGDMRNTGVELTLNVNPIRTENVNLTFNVNATHYKNVITRLPDAFRKDGIRRGSKLLKEGHSIYSYHLLHWMGVNPENGHPLYSYRQTPDGEWKTLEREGGANDKYLDNSRKWVGRALPDVSGGFGMQLEAYGIDFSAQFSYAIGGKIRDDGYADLMGNTSFGSGLHKDILKSWTKENRSTKYPIHEKDNSYNAAGSDRFLIDGSYLSFRSVVLGYTLPVRWTQRALLQQVRVYAVCDGVWLWSRRKGLDPRQFLDGIGGDSYSAIRTLSMGLQVKF